MTQPAIVATANGTGQSARATKLEAMRARVNALEGLKVALPAEEEELAALAAKEQAEIARIEGECEEALKRLTDLRVAEVREGLPAAQRASATLSGVCDWPTHKATATDTSSIDTILATGRGVMVITRLARGHQRAAVKALGRGGQRGTSLFEDDPLVIAEAMEKACLYPADRETVKLMCAESSAFTAAAYREACSLTGVWATVTAGK